MNNSKGANRPEKVTISVDVKMPGRAEFRHCEISVDFTSGKHAAVNIQQHGDGETADSFTQNWLKDALMLHQRKSEANLVPDDAAVMPAPKQVQ